MNTRAALACVALAAATVGLAGCGSSGNATTTNDATAAAGPTTPTSTSTTAGSGPKAAGSDRPGAAGPAAGGTGPGSAVATRSLLHGTVVSREDGVARISTDQGTRVVRWTPATTVVDTVAVRRGALPVGACVLVRPVTGGADATSPAFTASSVRLLAASPSCPPLRDRTGTDSQGAGAKPTGKPGAAPTAGLPGGESVTLVSGDGVIGTVSAVAGTRITLRSRADDRTRVVTVTTTPATRFRQSAGQTPGTTASRPPVRPGRCVVVWGAVSADGVDATRIRVSDPVDGRCDDPS